MFRRLFSAEKQSRSAKTVEAFGWLILIEGTIVLFAPNLALSILGIAPLSDQAANYFRLVGLLVCGVGMLLYRQRRLERGRIRFRLDARPPSRTCRNGDSLVSGDHPWAAGVDLFDPGFWQLSLDIVCVAR